MNSRRREEAVQRRSSMGRSHPEVGAPQRDISRLGTLGRRRNARSLRRSRGGSWSERFPTGHGRQASPQKSEGSNVKL